MSMTKIAPAAQKAVRCPTKRSVNLAKRPPRTRSAVTLVLGIVLIAALALAVAKFAVLDQLARQRAAEQQYQSVHAQYVEMQNALENYDAVEQEYRTYSRSWMTEENGGFVDVDRMDVLALLEQHKRTMTFKNGKESQLTYRMALEKLPPLEWLEKTLPSLAL